MNDFFLALGQSIHVDLFDLKSIEIRQITIEELENWLLATQQIKEFLKDKDYSDEVLTELFLTHGPYVIAMCALVTEFNQAMLLQFAQNQADFIRLMRHILTVNQAYFKEKEPKRRGLKDSVKESTWFDSFQALIRHGHTHSEVLKLSYGAFLAYLKAAHKAHRRELVSQLSITRLAYHGDGKAVKKQMDDLKAAD